MDLAFFSAGKNISEKWAPKAVEQGAIVIDNSSAHRMKPEIPLVVPEINFHSIKKPGQPSLIANPNCSTIQLVMVLSALKKFKLQRVQVSTYQSISGAGGKAMDQLMEQTKSLLQQMELEKAKPPSFLIQGNNWENQQEGETFRAFECHPEIGSLKALGLCLEEEKMIQETKKILSLPHLEMSAFTVRVPTLWGHGETLWLTLKEEVSMEQMEVALTQCPHIHYLPPREKNNFYPCKQFLNSTHAFVSRLHKDPSQERTWMMWIVADNIHRGAASNALLIADKIFQWNQ